KKSVSPTILKEPDSTVSKSVKPTTPAPKRTIRVRAKKHDLKTTKNVGGGTIITDSKAGGFKLIPSIVKSIDDWIKKTQKSLKKKAAPKYVITDTERRRGVIQKATSKTGSIFTADNETLKEEIRRRKVTAEISGDVDISWSPNTEVGYTLLETSTPKPVTSNVTVSFKKQSSPTPIVTVVEPQISTPPPAPVSPPTPEPEPLPVQAATPAPAIVEPTIVAEIVPEVLREITEPIVEEVQEIEVEETPTPEPVTDTYELTTPEEHYKIRSLGDITRINTNLLSIGIIGAIAGLIIFIVLIRAFFAFIIPDEAKISIEPPVPIAETTTATDVTVDTLSSQAILSAIQEASNVGSATELRFVNTEGQPISKDVLLPLLGFDSLPNLNRTISNVRVVVRGQERGLIFTATDSVTAFGSLLSWEKTLLNDLSNILAINTADLSGGFSDLTFGTTDVRVYTTNTAEQRLVYGFIDENTVVITNSPVFFTTILGSQ
ncbi:MAG: hypothetical protein KBB78_03425, partial [Candidatus Pacebacteria bacterium]|nr:hypothetical protein [Candidatus Paceibacterota bacterium]